MLNFKLAVKRSILLGSGLVGALVAVFRMEPDKFGVIRLQKAPEGKFHHAQHPHPQGEQLESIVDSLESVSSFLYQRDWCWMR